MAAQVSWRMGPSMAFWKALEMPSALSWQGGGGDWEGVGVGWRIWERGGGRMGDCR